MTIGFICDFDLTFLIDCMKLSSKMRGFYLPRESKGSTCGRNRFQSLKASFSSLLERQ